MPTSTFSCPRKAVQAGGAIAEIRAWQDTPDPASFPYDAVVGEYHRVGKHFVPVELLEALDRVRSELPQGSGRDHTRLVRFLSTALDKFDGRYDNPSYLALEQLSMPGADEHTGSAAAAHRRDRLLVLLMADMMRVELAAAAGQTDFLPEMRPEARVTAKRCRHGLRAARPALERLGIDVEIDEDEPIASAGRVCCAVLRNATPDEHRTLQLTGLPVSVIHDEYMFFRVLQSYEITFALAGVLIREAVTLIASGRGAEAARSIEEAGTVLGQSSALFSLVGTMRPEAFLAFREFTDGASAIQSRSYKRVESVCRRPDGERFESPAYESVPDVRDEVAAGLPNVDDGDDGRAPQRSHGPRGVRPDLRRKEGVRGRRLQVAQDPRVDRRAHAWRASRDRLHGGRQLSRSREGDPRLRLRLPGRSRDPGGPRPLRPRPPAMVRNDHVSIAPEWLIRAMRARVGGRTVAPMNNQYDAIVIGARCGGSPTAMLLARAGYRVLLVDKATFPSDTMSTHFAHPPAVAALERWGILERLEATGCPPVTTYEFDLGPVSICGSPRSVDGNATAFAPRRTVLDAFLVDAAVAAGAEMREAFTVDEVLFDNGRMSGIGGHAKGGGPVTERAHVVIGADGMHSLVAKAVRPRRYHEVPRLTPLYYAYWSGLPVDRFKTYDRAEHGRGWATWPTHDGLTCITQGWPQEEFEANRKDVEGTFMRSFDLVPEFAERIHAATRETRFVGSGNLPGFFRQPYGPGWALVGDAGQHKHPITGFGMSDAFRDAELLAAALDDYFAGRRPYDDALGSYQRDRDEQALPLYEITNEFAKLEEPPPDLQKLIDAMQGNQSAMDDFVSVMAATLPAPEFFAPENVGRIMERATAQL